MTVWQKIDSRSCGCDALDEVRSLINIDEALRRIEANATPVRGTEAVALAQARGRVLADPVRARAMTPPFDNAAMDGYAIDTAALAGAGPWTLQVAGRVPAGRAAGSALAGATAMRIFTGAPLPEGADAVVMQEEVRRRDDTIVLAVRPDPGRNIRRAGEDMAEGAPVLDAGCRLGPREIAACAAAGHGRVRVRRQVRVALLVTGDEVRQAGRGLGQAGIWDVNTPMLTAALDCRIARLVCVVHGADSRAGLQRQLAGMADEADLIVTTGGISVGEEDHVKPALAALGAEIAFSGVALKPGKPVSFGRVGGAHWLGLPGNPLSAYVTWNLFGIALMRALSGREGGAVPRRHVLTGQSVRRRPGRCELRPARIVGFDGQGRDVICFDEATHSGRVAGLPAADGLMFLPGDIETLPEGALVEFQPFRDS